MSNDLANLHIRELCQKVYAYVVEERVQGDAKSTARDESAHKFSIRCGEKQRLVDAYEDAKRSLKNAKTDTANLSKLEKDCEIAKRNRDEFQHDPTEWERLNEDSDQASEERDNKPTFFDHFIDRVSVHSGFGLTDVWNYINRTGRGCIWEARQRLNGEQWDDITELASKMDDKSDRLVRCLVPEIWEHYPHVATRIGLPVCRKGEERWDQSQDLGERSPSATKSPTRHSPDFRSVHWYGVDYTFTSSQAAVVKVLWDAWENGTPDVSTSYLMESADLLSNRLVDTFRNNSAWGTLVVDGATKGSKRLADPQES